MLQDEFPGLTIPEVPDLPELHAMLTEKLATWEDEFKHEGEERGSIQGEARLLHRLLERRFGTVPDWVETKLAAGTEDYLVHWGENVIDAETLNEIFSR